MTDLAIGPKHYAVRSWWLSLSAWLVVAWLALHLLGVVMTVHLEARLGFFPIWFLDCVACSAPEFSLPYGTAVVGGVSLGGVVGLLTAFPLLRNRTDSGWVLLVGLVMVVAMAFHVVVTWPARYPGSLPPLVVAVVLPFGASLAGALGLFGVPRESSEVAVGPKRVSVWAVACLASGTVSMAFLGGLATVAAMLVCGWRIRSPRFGWDRVLVISGGVLAVLSMVLRMMLRIRYPSTFGWFW